MKGSAKKTLKHLFLSVISIVLCASIIGTTSTVAFAGVVYDEVQQENVLRFNSVDDIAADQVCLIVFEDMTQKGADSEGRAIIGGNLTVEQGWSASVKSKFNNDYALIVGGNLETESNIDIGGCLAVGGTVSGSFNANTCADGSNHIHKDNSGWIEAYISAAEAHFKSASKMYAERPADGTANPNWGDIVPSPDHVVGTPHVFHVDGTNGVAFNFGQGLAAYGSDSIIINISGKNVKINGANYNGGDKAEFCSRTVWNCYEAETVTITNGSVQGSLLAPYASVSGSGGHVNGTTIVREMHGLGGFEYHTGQFFRDPFSATLTVTKEVIGGASDDATFGFAIYQQNGSSWTEKETFTLKAGESAKFNDLLEGNTYKVVETDSGNGYGFVSVTGGSVNDNEEKSATFTVTTTGYKVLFTNEAKTGSITVTKKLVDTVDPDASFTFTLQKKSGSTWENVTGGSFSLTNGASKTIEGLEYGDYRVVEDTNGSVYTTTVGAQAGNVAEVALTASNAAPTVEFTNTRNTAKLTVVKKIAAGDKDNGESFTFQLFEAKDGAWAPKGDAFTLKNGESKAFDLPVGIEYKVEETSSGKSYTLTGVSPSNEVKLASDYTMTFTNSIARMGITVSKEVTGGGNANDEFTFTIKGRELDETFTLKAGQSKTFENLQEGDTYVVTETGMGSIYELVSVEGGKVAGNASTVTVAQGASVTFKNAVKTGEITIGKTLVDTVAPDATFTFNVKDAAGNIINTVTLANGETATVSGLPYGQTYTVEEAVDGSSYVTTYSVDSKASAQGAAAKVTIGGKHTVDFTNTRATNKLTVVKKLADGSADMGETFTFQLYKKANGTWAAQGEPFALKANASASFTVDVGAEYAVVETDSGEFYELASAEGGTSVIIAGSAGTSKVVAGNETFTFTNKVKTGSIYVYKKLNDNIATDASFTFTLQKKVADKWVDVEMISFGNEEGYEFKGLDYGNTYRVVETVDSAIYSTIYNVYADATLSGGKLTVSGSSASGSSATSSEFVLDSALKAVVYTNTRKTATLKVSKALESGNANLGESFTFEIQRNDGSKWVAVKTFTLKAGDAPYSVELEVGVNYRVVETKTGASYSFSSVAGANAVEGLTGGQINFTKDAEVVIYNKIKTGEITVTKTLNDATSPDAQFTFTLYKKSGSGWISTGETFILKGGETKTIGDLPYGETYKVVETGSDLYTTYNTIADVKTEGNETPEIVMGKATVEVNYTNTRKTATLTVEKKLKDGSYNFGDTFKFVLERQKADKTWEEVQAFTLKAGEKNSFKLAIGETYRVIETDSSANYDFYNVEGDGSYIVAENGKGASIALGADAEITVVNKTKGASLTVRKAVVGTGTATDTFSFKLQKLEGTAWTDVEVFDLKAGEAKDFDVQLGDSYRVYETKLGSSYELTNITGGDTNVIEEAYAEVQIDGAEDITFVNSVKKGSIVITKTLVDALNADAKFAFTVQAQVDGEWITIGNGLIGNGESFKVDDIEYGTLVKVIEAVDSAKYTTVSDKGEGAEAQLTISGDAELNFTNTRKNATLKVTKKLADGSSSVGGSFAFELFVKEGTAWTSVEKFTLEAGATKTFDKLYAGADYMVVETLADGSKYIFDKVEGGSFTEYKDNPGATVTASASAAANVVFYNANSSAKLVVEKIVVGDAGEDTFSFELQKKEGAAYKTVDTFILKAGESKTLDVVYGSSYRVVESKLGDIYKLTAIDGADTNSLANRTADVRIVTGEEKITFTNTVKSAKLVVTKALAEGSKDLGETFAFELFVKDGTKWTSVEEFELSANGKKEFTDLVAGKEYLVVEKLTAKSKYNFVSVTGATVTEYNNNNGGAVTLLPDVSNDVVFTNMVKGASLTINKSVVGDAKADTFTFDIYKKNGTKYDVYKKGVVVTPGTPVTFTEGVSIGDEFKIVESGMASRFELTAIAGADNSDMAEKAAFVKIGADGSSVTFTNTVRSASLKVSKVLAEGSNNLGGTFTFELYKMVDGKWEYEKSFELGLGKSATFTDLIAGEQYLVIEKLADGSVYAFASVAGGTAETLDGFNGASVTADADKEASIVFTNKNAEASLTVKKVVSGTANENIFAFELQKKVDGKYTTVEEFNLTAGQTKDFTVNYGDEYRVVEVAVGGRYTLTSITGADEIDLADKYGDVKIDGAEVVTFTNTVNTGSLTVTKTVVEDIDSGASFTFQLMKWDAQKEEFVNDGEAFQLANGEKKTFEGLEYGSVYVVKETENSSYTTKYKVGASDEAAGLEAAYTVNAKAETIKFTNTRKQATLTVDKAITGADNGYEFTFQLQQKDGEGWKNVGSSFKLSAAAEPKSFEVDIDTKYRVIELDTGDSYEFASADVDGASDEVVITDNGNKGVEFTLIGNADVTITNAIKKTKLTLSKRVDGFANGDTFTFTVSKNGGEAVTYTLKAGEFVDIDADYEDVFVITEGALSARYVLSGIVGADSVEGATATIAINSDNEAVEYTNKVKTGEIIIKKNLTDIASPNKKFVFTAEYSTDGNTWQPLLDETNSSTKSLGNGEQWKITGIQYGTMVRITETVDGKLYTTTNTVTSGAVATVTIDDATETVEFNNVRNTTKLSVYKKLKDGDVNTGDVFKFTIDGPNYDNHEFTLQVAEGDTTTNFVVFDKIVVGADYTITETDSGKNYTLYSVEADGEEIANGASINIVEEMSVVFTNTVKSGELTVKKELNDDVDPNATFVVTATITDAEGNVTTQSGSISATNSKTFTGIPFGSTVVVEEKVNDKLYSTTYKVGENATNSVVIASDKNEMIITNTRKTAKLTVAKQLAEGDKDLGESFMFQLYELKGEEWVKKGDAFALKNGESKVFDLPVGVDYKVEETNTGDNYTFTGVTPSNEINLASDYTMTFTNSIARMGITVNKIVVGSGKADDEFTFTIEGRDLKETFTLKAGETKTFDGLQKGDAYVITETTMGSIYELDAISGGTVNGRATTVIVDQGAQVTFTNKVKEGELTVTKQLVDAIAPNAEFAVTATITDLQGNVTTQSGIISATKSATFTKIPYGSTVVVEETVDGSIYTTAYKVGETETNAVVISSDATAMVITNTRREANLTIQKTVGGLMDEGEEFIITVTGVFSDNALEQTKTYYFAKEAAEATETTDARYAIGTAVKVDNVLYGATYAIEEKTGDVNYYATTVDGVLGTTGKVTATGDTAVVVDNPRKVADLTVAKSLEAGSEDLGETFTFQLYRMRNNAWEAVDAAFELKAGESKTFTDLAVGFTYKVIETKTGESYLFGSVPEGTTLVNDEEGMGAMFVLDKTMTVDISNRRNPYSITVRKIVSEDGGDANAEFTFELQKKNGSKWDTVETFTLKANGDKLFQNLTEGDVYRVVETDTGAAYDFDSVTIKKMGENDSVDNNKCAATVTIDGAEDIVFKNVPKTQTLAVTKDVVGTDDTTAKFKFELWKNTGSGWTFEKDFVLSAGKTEKIDVIYGVEYKVVEAATGASYELKKIDGADSYDLAKASGTVTVDGDEEIIFTNELATGSITVTKTVTGYDVSNRSFTFQLADQDGYVVTADGTNASGKFSLKNGESITLTGIPCGTVVYVIEEVDAENYQTSYSVDGSDYYTGNTTSTVVIGTSNIGISFVNNYIGEVVLGASNSVDVQSSTTKPVVDETPVINVQESSPVINKVLGDYDTPQTGDGDIPMPIIVAMAASVIIILSFGKKKKSGYGAR